MPPRLLGALLLGALAVGACSGVRVQRGEVSTERTRYRFGDPGSDWRRVSLSDVDVAWVRDSSGHTLSVSSMCQDYQEASLTALRRQQLVGFTDSERVEEREQMLDGRAALFSRWRAKLDGVPVELGLWTLKKDGCVYDFTYTSPNGAYDEQSQALARVVQGFATERVK
ncbi:MAG TPA: hypothetical protein VMH40_06585 [Myxococcaceae bacterium]|nr:hypothetical protein [Myxococcaceae bacterium]